MGEVVVQSDLVEEVGLEVGLWLFVTLSLVVEVVQDHGAEDLVKVAVLVLDALVEGEVVQQHLLIFPAP